MVGIGVGQDYHSPRRPRTEESIWVELVVHSRQKYQPQVVWTLPHLSTILLLTLTMMTGAWISPNLHRTCVRCNALQKLYPLFLPMTIHHEASFALNYFAAPQLTVEHEVDIEQGSI